MNQDPGGTSRLGLYCTHVSATSTCQSYILKLKDILKLFLIIFETPVEMVFEYVKIIKTSILHGFLSIYI